MTRINHLPLVFPGVLFLACAAANESFDENPATGETEAATEQEIEEMVVIGRVETSHEPIGVYMDAETLAGIPGIHDDPLHAIGTLPGVAVTNDFEGGFAVRGTRPVDNTYRVDFLGVGYLFHFGTGSVVDGDVVEGFQFFPAGYGARYQGAIGAAVDVRTRDPRSDGLHALLDANFTHGGVLLEGPLTENQRAYFSARRSYYDLLLEPFLDKINDQETDDVDVVQLPKSRDYRGRYQINVGENYRLDILVDGAGDEAELLYHDESTEVLQDPALSGAHRFALAYRREGIVLSREGNADTGSFEAGWGRNETEFNARLGGAGHAGTLITDNSLRVEASSRHMGVHELSIGATFSHLNVDYDVLLRDTGCTEFEVNCRFSDAEHVTAKDEIGLQRLHFFVEDTLRFADQLDLTVGSGYTRDNYLHESAVEPRARLTWRWLPNSSLIVATGRYHQLPAFEYIEANLGNPALPYLTANHYAVALDYRFRNGWFARWDIYRKDSWNLVTANDATRYDSHGEGVARGVEMLIQGHFGPRWLGWAAVSYSNSVREDRDTGHRFDFAHDQPIIASLVLKHGFNDRWTFSARTAYHSGAPHTPITGGEPDPDSPGGYLPIYAEVNSGRLPSYFRLDLRADWQPERWRGGVLYIEFQNATNHQNVSGYEYEADYSSREPISQVPAFISLGVKKAW